MFVNLLVLLCVEINTLCLDMSCACEATRLLSVRREFLTSERICMYRDVLYADRILGSILLVNCDGLHLG